MTAQKPARIFALLDYLLPVIGPVYVILAQRRDPLALYHAYQSLALVAAVIVAPVVWAVAAWVLAWIPLAGPLLAAASFALVIAIYITVIVGWVRGIIAAFQAKIQAVPVFGHWGERWMV